MVDSRVHVDEQLFERLGRKLVENRPGFDWVESGDLVVPPDTWRTYEGDPWFLVRLPYEVFSNADLPDEVGFALRRVVDRLYQVLPDGTEVEGEMGPIEGAGFVVHDGVVVVETDTDGWYYTRATVDAMAKIFVEELGPLGINVEVTAAPYFDEAANGAWQSAAERDARGTGDGG